MRKEFFDGTEVGSGYCRLLQVGSNVFISGTGSADTDGNVVGENVYEQTKIIYQKMESSLKEVGLSLRNIVRISAYVTDIATAGEFLKAHGEAFGQVAIAATLVEVSGLVKGFKVEIEAQALASLACVPA
ncbi:Rid family hydrolase [Aquamicrobium sp.]|uniref:Rid family hydrolase n=1 Tax=Aquamicrobium sp. TaxID=1872579 RepID=UPI00258BC3B9|nr:Rid family hydrolase [Aquamicrobium sp.]MCK9550996.1 Rid family hydrolase [Aquamicrobium sp.]